MPKPFRFSLILPVSAFFIYLWRSAPFLGQWDSYDYLKQIVSHQLSALGFGRPVFLGYNIFLWESAKTLFGLGPLKVEFVVMLGTVALGVAGVVLFAQLARQLLPAPASRMAALAFAISPMYAIYSGFIMTEVPMLVALTASALLLWKPGDKHPALNEIASGILFGAAVGIREQALTAGAVYLWILFSRPQPARPQIPSLVRFGLAAGAATAAPVLLFYYFDPAGFVEHTNVWLRAIPMGSPQFWNNLQASLLWTVAICPASWLSLGGAAIAARSKRRAQQSLVEAIPVIPNPFAGFLCAVVLPIVLLWRDADVQIHPRYVMTALPGSIIFCACLYSRWARSRKSVLLWAAAHVLVFGMAMAAVNPYFQDQAEKMQGARAMKDAVPGRGLLIAGSYSPMLDYYRGIGVRPQWQILWSGWDWSPAAAESSIRKAWAEQVPVYISEDPLGWRYFETEYLHFHLLLRNHKKEAVSGKFYRVYPDPS